MNPIYEKALAEARRHVDAARAKQVRSARKPAPAPQPKAAAKPTAPAPAGGEDDALLEELYTKGG